MKLKDKVALVTGSSRSISKAIARELAVHGTLVAINYANNRDAADNTIEEITAAANC